MGLSAFAVGDEALAGRYLGFGWECVAPRQARVCVGSLMAKVAGFQQQEQTRPADTSFRLPLESPCGIQEM